MKNNSRIFNFLIAISVIISMVGISASATSLDTQSETLYSEITREQYIAHIAQANDVAYDTAEAEVNQAILTTIAKHNIPVATPFGFDETNYDYINGVKTAYGYWVSEKTIPKTGNVMHVRMSVYSIVVSAPQGRYISHVDDSLDVLPGSSGDYTITASGNVSWDDYTVHMSSSGNAEITLDIAHEIGLDAVWISYGQSMGTTNYLRFPFSVGETFRVTNF